MGEYRLDQYYDFPQENESYVHRIARTRKSGKIKDGNLLRHADRGQVDGVMENIPNRRWSDVGVSFFCVLMFIYRIY